MTNEKQETRITGISGLVFVGCLLISLAIGLSMGNMAVTLLAGLGIGFLAMAITRAITGAW